MQISHKMRTAHIVAAALLICGPTIAEAPLGSGFTYQGNLERFGWPLNDTADFEFTLFDAEIDGNPVGDVVTVADVQVVDGLFTVTIDFGADVFDGEALWLEIAVRAPAGQGEFTSLSPRQPLTATPYALFALNGIEGPPGPE